MLLPVPTVCFGFYHISSVLVSCLATAVITEGGRLWTFGQGDSNQLGQGNTEDSSNQVLPCEVEDAFDGEAVIDVSVCDGHMAAVTRDGSVWTWGRSTFGRLGHEYFSKLTYCN